MIFCAQSTKYYIDWFVDTYVEPNLAQNMKTNILTGLWTRTCLLCVEFYAKNTKNFKKLSDSPQIFTGYN